MDFLDFINNIFSGLSKSILCFLLTGCIPLIESPKMSNEKSILSNTPKTTPNSTGVSVKEMGSSIDVIATKTIITVYFPFKETCRDNRGNISISINRGNSINAPRDPRCDRDAPHAVSSILKDSIGRRYSGITYSGILTIYSSDLAFLFCPNSGNEKYTLEVYEPEKPVFSDDRLDALINAICKPANSDIEGDWKAEMYRRNENVEVRQPNSNKFWLRCPIGQTWKEKECVRNMPESARQKYWIERDCNSPDEPVWMTWNTAQNACPDGYHLPSEDDYKSLFCGNKDINCPSCTANPVCAGGMFTFGTGRFWTSTEGYFAGEAFNGDFTRGNAKTVPKNFCRPVLCIREDSAIDCSDNCMQTTKDEYGCCLSTDRPTQ